MTRTPSCSLAWIRIGVAAGIASCLAYTLIAVVHLPRPALVMVAAAFGPLLGVATLGLGKLLQISHKSVPAQLAVLFNFAGGALVTSMLLVQLAIKERVSGKSVPTEVAGIWLGLDVAWDVYIGLGTGLLALAMFRHPRFGIFFGSVGLLIAVFLLAFNLYTFPVPPGDAGLVDIGPLVGLSLGWASSVVSQ